MRWLHVSDLHFHPEQDGRGARTLRESLPQYLKEHIGKVNLVFMTGDFRHAKYQKDDPNAAVNSVAYLLKIAESVGVTDPARIHIVPGNHDLKRDASTAGMKEILDITDKYNVDVGNFWGKEAFLWKRFDFFREAASHLHEEGSIWPEDLALLHPYRCFDEYSIVYMNTAISIGRMVHKDGKDVDDDRGNMVIGNDALDLSLGAAARENPNKPIIVLAHHATELFSKHEREAVEEILKKYPVVAYLCGDAHEPWCREINGVAEITMGCMEFEAGVKSVFSVGELLPTGAVSITAHEWRSHPDGWCEYKQFNNYFFGLFPPAISRPEGPFGRDALLEDIVECLNSMTLAEKKIIEVNGEPGNGKTTVCWEVLRKVAPADCFTIALRGMLSRDAAQDQILRSLGVSTIEGEPLDAQIEAFARKKPNAVLYLDNAEDPLKDAAFKSWLLDSIPMKTSWRVIYSTSMSMKHTNVKSFRVPVLDKPDAKAMFRSLFGSTTAEDEAALEGLLVDLSCHPLSIMLVTAQKDLYPTVKELHRAWRSANDVAHDYFRLEDDAGPHASFRSAIKMSFEAISENRIARVLWGVMSYLPANMPKALLDRAFSNDLSSAATGIKVLVKNCLLTARPTQDGEICYGMLNPIKDMAFAFDSRGPVKDESFTRLLEAFLTVFTTASDPNAQSRQESHYLALDIMPDVIAFMDGILQKDEYSSTLLVLLKAMEKYFCYNVIISLDLLDKIAPMSISSKKDAAFICYRKGDLELLLGKIDEAQAHYEEAEVLYRQERSDFGLANVLKSKGDLELLLGKTDEAQAHYEEADVLYRQERYTLGLANVLQSIGDLEICLGKIDEAQTHYAAVEVLYRQERYTLGLANGLLSMGNLESCLGKFDEAQAHYKEAEVLYRQERYNLGLASVLQSMGDLDSSLKKINEAQAHYEEAEGLYSQERYILDLANILQSRRYLERSIGHKKRS